METKVDKLINIKKLRKEKIIVEADIQLLKKKCCEIEQKIARIYYGDEE